MNADYYANIDVLDSNKYKPIQILNNCVIHIKFAFTKTKNCTTKKTVK